jgi:hypothetical protein
MHDTKTITEFMDSININTLVFDMGRRIIQLDHDYFIKFDKGNAGYIQPLQREAWLGMLCHDNENPHIRFLWFIKFPLDEQAKLNVLARDDFIHHLIKAGIEKGLQNNNEEDLDDAVKNNPYGFVPSEERMACLHAKALLINELEPSKYYQHTKEYFSGKLGFDQWSFVGIQGIADLSARHKEQDNETLLVNAIPALPKQPLIALCKCLENEPIGNSIAEVIGKRIREELAHPTNDTDFISACIRGLSYSQATELRQELLEEILSGEQSTNIEILAAVAGRCWEDLKDTQINQMFIEALASNSSGQSSFNHLVADLLFIPGMREYLLNALRNPERSNNLARAMGDFFKSFS